ncbi:MAG: DEAD/DEAH box helicase [Gammaproteobacteria bacterium]|jgi:superfamily II DNA/RNA helicase|uniref:Superfamily II DNA and RNA helicase n=1 Tax=Marinomonas polaris DSM 16579 TaxID=1122206 RepID=A0A1M5HQW6_9GAMM|nr:MULTISPECIES: DEAD/DEAH box helicase [Marinomonas]MBU1295112.1 DEAD/DEAH box helicase [Gammaproteobacteria bacterium]MBU1467349.1 DEAD/DEAH box helicase [Gammaproteobacteria bacterium]MBU2023441.1 DEAD/DEAH box helicase [Gammaproteobacteria bacterium]MBU2240753.1 DEAD/DEAH box helicase [Gammaproteobacteria bacterium]MBU2317169.1 DEAD/DEAH box helicase [Gammaproteobacteria bacterium]|tara:strand:- start:16002 stop:17198 length:1197 start_codon:yes stop_codon:yes gene_type:complete
MPFAKLGLSSPLVKAITELGYKTPTPVQKQAIPIILSGKDLIATAQTGTGKTAAFVLPLLERFTKAGTLRGKRIRVLILVPTRELAVQVEASVAQYAKHTKLTSMAVYGGVDTEAQKERLIEGVDILVATPGRLLDLAHQRALHFDELKVMVLDEADRMVDMGFVGDINKIMERLPENRQNLLFSATMTDDVRALAFDFSDSKMTDLAAEISISPNVRAAASIKQWLITVDKDTKSALLSHLINEQKWDQALIFIEKKHGAAKLVDQLAKRGIVADCIHGDRSQAMREKILAQFKSGELKYLVATGVAARGLDIGSLSRVVNYDLPFKPEEYIHRIGRTGRAGASGEAISFVAMGDFKNLCAIESRLKHIIDRKEIAGFPVRKVVPVSILNYVRKANR